MLMYVREKGRKSRIRGLMAILAILLMAGGCTMPWQATETEEISESTELVPAESEALTDSTTAPESEVPVTTAVKDDKETMESFKRAFNKLDAADLITYEGKFKGVPVLCFSTKELCIELLLDVKSNAAGVIIAQDFGNDEWRSLTVPKGAGKRDLVIQNINAFKYNPKLAHTGHNAFLGEARSCDAVSYIDGTTIEGTYRTSDTTFKAYLINDTITAISTAANYDVNIYPAAFSDKDSFDTSIRILQDMATKLELMTDDTQGYIAAVRENVKYELVRLYEILEEANTLTESIV